ncbi:hypothetical protein [Alistipes sp.]|uniref:hypothetical protein n=1 Tax=Alistipes sp. TaxID=1872444 RepID=UPI0011C9A49E
MRPVAAVLLSLVDKHSFFCSSSRKESEDSDAERAQIAGIEEVECPVAAAGIEKVGMALKVEPDEKVEAVEKIEQTGRDKRSSSPKPNNRLI